MSLALHRQASPRLWLHLIGSMQAVDAHGNSLLPRTRKARAVLAILALASPKPVTRARITALLWSRREREQARGSLRQCIHELQGLLQALGPGVLEADREQLRLTEEAVWIDLHQTEAVGGVLLEDLGGLDPAFDAWLEAEQALLAAPARSEAPAARGVRLGVRPLRLLGLEDDTPEDRALTDGLGHEIAAALSRFRWIGCLSPSALWESATEPEADYALDGTVRRAGPLVRVALRLQDMRSAGEVVWARNFDFEAIDLLGLQDAIAAETAAQVEPELLLREGARAASRVARDPTSHDLTLAAIPGILRLERDGFARAGRMLSEAVRLAPEHVPAHSWFAYWHVMAVGQGWEIDAGAAMARAGELAERAVTLDPSDARALTVAGHVRSFLDRQVEEALALHERALALNPALPLAWMMSGLAYCYRGEHLEAIRRIERARRLSPFDPHAFFFDMALMMPHLLLGEYERAALLGRLTAQLKPGFSSSWKALLSALGHLGRSGEAVEVRSRLLSIEPDFTVGEAIRRSPLLRPVDLARFAEGLRLGGLAE